VQQALDCPLWAAENGGSACVQHNIRAIAIAPYFGYYLGLPENELSVDAWASQSDGGLTSLFGELLQGGGLSTSPVGGALEDARQQMLQNKAVASQYGVQLVAYEGGQHLVGVGAVTNNDAVSNLFQAANRDSRMGATYQQHLQEWIDAGGGLYNLWNSVGGYSKWGSWGLLEYRDQGSSPKFDAVKNFLTL
ncbi:MAG: cellulose-binding protein, partial [Methylococcus sp.]|nr:cellulose-binding protein [Methylococcus sp.]